MARKVHGMVEVSGAGRASEPGTPGTRQEYRDADQMTADPSVLGRVFAKSESSEDDINAAAVAAYRTSISTGRPLSVRKLAAMFGKTSRRWARGRMADARDVSGAWVAAGR